MYEWMNWRNELRSSGPMPMCENASLSSRALDAIGQYLARADSESVSRMHLAGTGAVAELEEKLRRHYGMRHALCVPNATSGLLGLALALELRDAEFVCSPLLYGGSIAAWLTLGNRPRFADVDPHDLALDPESARPVITSATKAVLAVDLFGVPSDTQALRRLADEFGLWYIADGAQSLGASRNGLPAGVLADAVVVSFTTGKTIFAGEGGAVLTNHAELYQKLLWFTQHPERQRRELGLGLWNEFALNARIHPLAAVWANALFEASLDALQPHRQRCFAIIDALNEIGFTEPIEFRRAGILPSFFRLTAAWSAKPRPRKLLRELASHGTTVRIEPPPARLVYRDPAFLAQYSVHEDPRCPNAERQQLLRFCLACNRNPGGLRRVVRSKNAVAVVFSP